MMFFEKLFRRELCDYVVGLFSNSAEYSFMSSRESFNFSIRFGDKIGMFGVPCPMISLKFERDGGFYRTTYWSGIVFHASVCKIPAPSIWCMIPRIRKKRVEECAATIMGTIRLPLTVLMLTKTVSMSDKVDKYLDLVEESLSYVPEEIPEDVQMEIYRRLGVSGIFKIKNPCAALIEICGSANSLRKAGMFR